MVPLVRLSLAGDGIYIRQRLVLPVVRFVNNNCGRHSLVNNNRNLNESWVRDSGGAAEQGGCGRSFRRPV